MGVALQVIAFVVAIAGSITGILELDGLRFSTQGVVIIGASLLAGMLLYGVGGALSNLEDIRNDVRRIADNNTRRQIETLPIVNKDEPSTIQAAPTRSTVIRKLGDPPNP